MAAEPERAEDEESAMLTAALRDLILKQRREDTQLERDRFDSEMKAIQPPLSREQLSHYRHQLVLDQARNAASDNDDDDDAAAAAAAVRASRQAGLYPNTCPAGTILRWDDEKCIDTVTHEVAAEPCAHLHDAGWAIWMRRDLLRCVPQGWMADEVPPEAAPWWPKFEALALAHDPATTSTSVLESQLRRMLSRTISSDQIKMLATIVDLLSHDASGTGLRRDTLLWLVNWIGQECLERNNFDAMCGRRLGYLQEQFKRAARHSGGEEKTPADKSWFVPFLLLQEPNPEEEYEEGQAEEEQQQPWRTPEDVIDWAAAYFDAWAPPPHHEPVVLRAHVHALNTDQPGEVLHYTFERAINGDDSYTIKPMLVE